MWNAINLAMCGITAFGLGICYFLPEPSAQETVSPTSETAAPTPKNVPGVPSELEPAKSASSAVPLVNPRLTWTNYDWIRQGMSEEQVTALLGKPTSSEIESEFNGRKVKILRWAQLEPPVRIEVEFINGLSGAGATTLTPPAIPTEPIDPLGSGESQHGTDKLTRANFEFIRNGMSEDEVIAILGRAGGSSTRTITSNGQTNTTRVLTWRSRPSLTITVTLRNERVSGKNWTHLTPLKR